MHAMCLEKLLSMYRLCSPFADLLSAFAFFKTSLLPNLELNKPHAFVVCIVLLASLVVVPTQDFCFVFFFKKTIILRLEGGSKG